MTGGLLQLVAYGKQDRFLIGNPQITFFKMIYKRHNNFSIETKKVDFIENLKFGTTISCVIPKNGDLLKNMCLQFELPELESNFGYVNNIGHSFIQDLSIEIGNTKIDSHTGEWFNIWSELSTKEEKKNGLNTMLGKFPFSSYSSSDNTGGKFIVPINFWFCRHNGLSLPLVALQYHEVTIKLKIRPFNELWIPNIVNTNPNNKYKPLNCNLLIDYIYLDNLERKKFAQDTHEYLIKQIQLNKTNMVPSKNNSKIFELQLKHPVTELIWVIQRTDVSQKFANRGCDWFNYSDSLTAPYNDPIITAQIKLNGTDRTIEMDPQYLRLYQPYCYHTSIPDSFIYSYSFSLNPELIQPSGSCNFSRFDSAQLSIVLKDDLPDCNIRVYAINYNILKIMCGMGGIMYID